MPAIVVCPLSRLEATLAQIGSTSVVTLMRRGKTAVPDLPGVERLWLEFSDIVEATDGYTLPGAAHLDALIGFAATWDRLNPLLMHCYAGVSRSTAAAYVVACALHPDVDEAELATRLREASPTATPNARIVALADERLGRSGRMIEAIAAIGRGADCFEGQPFRLEIGRQIPPYQS